MSKSCRNEIFIEAFKLAEAQAGLKKMSSEEVIEYAVSVAHNLQTIGLKNDVLSNGGAVKACADEIDPDKSIDQYAVTCLECGRKFRMLTSHHLSEHGLTKTTYREKWGIKRDKPLVCDELSRMKRKLLGEHQAQAHPETTDSD